MSSGPNWFIEVVPGQRGLPCLGTKRKKKKKNPDRLFYTGPNLALMVTGSWRLGGPGFPAEGSVHEVFSLFLVSMSSARKPGYPFSPDLLMGLQDKCL